MIPELSSAERKQLRGLAMNLKHALSVGQKGLTEAVLKEIDAALTQHELIKLRFGCERDAQKAFCQRIQEELNCTLCGSIGHTASFYRKKPKEA